MTYTTTELSALKKLNQITDTLDAGCQSGEVQNDVVAKAQGIINRTHSLLGDKANDQKAFIIYEAQSIIHWINGEKDEAFELINSAKDIKGDRNLQTETGRDILAVASPAKKSTLGFLSIAIGVVAITYMPAIGLIAVILGVLALRKYESRNVAVSGIILGSIALLMFALIFAAIPKLQENQRKAVERNESLQN